MRGESERIAMRARYAFRVTIRLEPVAADCSLEDPTVERRCFLEAAEPGTDGWRRFRELLWRGELTDAAYGRALFTEKLGLPVEDVEFRAFYTDEEYLEALEDEIEANLESFKAESVTEVLSKYFASSLEVGVDHGLEM
ncbi:LWR-salt protein [Natronosalvus vescus]|uniref:LWR-salt protein n=1 Tax=Natronosalvus vescus TaxID=2953881 RepID=UPI00288066F7|nr:LWR-salt protein [Natronosalvus vescus]